MYGNGVNYLKLNIGLVVLLSILMELNIVSAKVFNADDIFPVGRVLDIQIMVDPNNWATTCSQMRDFNTVLTSKRKNDPPENPFTYVEAEVTIDGITFPQGGIRKKCFLGFH